MNLERIKRNQLPSYERRGFFAQEIIGTRLVYFRLKLSGVDATTLGGVPVDIPSCLSNIVPKIGGTVFLSSISGDNVSILDITTYLGKPCVLMPWSDRFDLIGKICNNFTIPMVEYCSFSTLRSVGLIPFYDEVVSSGGLGLLLREHGRDNILLCC